MPLRGRRENLGAELQKHAGKTLNLREKKSIVRRNNERIGETSERVLQNSLHILNVSTKSMQNK